MSHCRLVWVHTLADGRELHQCMAPRCGQQVVLAHRDESAEVTCLGDLEPQIVYVVSPHPLSLSSLRARWAALRQSWRKFRAAEQRFFGAGEPRVYNCDELRRLTTCLGCPVRGEKLGGYTCRLCGCWLSTPWLLGPLLAVLWFFGWERKTRWATEHCPRGLWTGDPASGCATCGPSLPIITRPT